MTDTVRRTMERVMDEGVVFDDNDEEKTKLSDAKAAAEAAEAFTDIVDTEIGALEYSRFADLDFSKVRRKQKLWSRLFESHPPEVVSVAKRPRVPLDESWGRGRKTSILCFHRTVVDAALLAAATIIFSTGLTVLLASRDSTDAAHGGRLSRHRLC